MTNKTLNADLMDNAKIFWDYEPIEELAKRHGISIVSIEHDHSIQTSGVQKHPNPDNKVFSHYYGMMK